MVIKIKLSRILGEKRINMSNLAKEANITRNTVFSLYHEKAKGITFEVLNKICKSLNCQPGDLLEYIPDEDGDS